MLNSRSSSAAFHLGKSTPFSNLLALYSLNFFEKRKTLGAAALEKFFFFSFTPTGRYYSLSY